ncbi:MAG: hypothetical protein KGL39_54760 [Patescibacteria group bacterium]|nr:hypothetical protein [Patescibacteria group bacterium]
MQGTIRIPGGVALVSASHSSAEGLVRHAASKYATEGKWYLVDSLARLIAEEIRTNPNINPDLIFHDDRLEDDRVSLDFQPIALLIDWVSNLSSIPRIHENWNAVRGKDVLLITHRTIPINDIAHDLLQHGANSVQRIALVNAIVSFTV